MCELCDAEPRTYRYAEDSIAWAANCATCDVPMVVLREHRAEPTPEEHERMLELLRYAAKQYFGDEPWVLDTQPRSVQNHAHYHARPVDA